LVGWIYYESFISGFNIRFALTDICFIMRFMDLFKRIISVAEMCDWLIEQLKCSLNQHNQQAILWTIYEIFVKLHENLGAYDTPTAPHIQKLLSSVVTVTI